MKYLTKQELLLWLCSLSVITVSFFIFDSEGYLTLAASLIGVTSLIFCAKGNPAGQVLMIIFSLFYGYISFGFAYYGEMVTYLGMTLPMSVLSLASWVKNPAVKGKPEVRISRLKKGEVPLMIFLTVSVTAAFFFILRFFNTANLIPSTLSVTTSFLAAYLTFRRNPCFPLFYAFNDIVLLVLWSLAAREDSSYASVISCFAVFLVNDLYGFYNWNKMRKRQNARVLQHK